MKVLIEIEKKILLVWEWATKLWITERHMIRIKKRYQKLWERWIVHKLRWKKWNRSMDERTKETIKVILTEWSYEWFWPTYLKEEVFESRMGIKVSKETLRKIMVECGMRIPKEKKERKQRKLRKRKEMFGEMQQFDGSYHIWFGEEVRCLLLSVDDATSQITHAVFAKNEGKQCVFQFREEYFHKQGRPRSIYLDKFATYKVNNIPTAVFEPEVLTQFESVCRDLDVQIIHAHSAEAKGRVERANRTLQDRLVKDLKLEWITSIDEANEYLQKIYIPKHNKKFSVQALSDGNCHRTINQGEEDFYWVMSFREERTVKNDYTIQYKNQIIQLENVWEKTRPKLEVFVYERYDTWELKITNQWWKTLVHKKVEKRPAYIDPVKKEQEKKKREKKEKEWKKREKKRYGEAKERQRKFRVLQLVFFQKVSKSHQDLPKIELLKMAKKLASESLAWRWENHLASDSL